MMPSLFIAHGSPSLAIENNDYTNSLHQLGQNLPRPKGHCYFFCSLGISGSTGESSRSI